MAALAICSGLLDKLLKLGKFVRKLGEQVSGLAGGLSIRTAKFLLRANFLVLMTILGIMRCVRSAVLLAQLTKMIRRRFCFLRDAIGRGTHTFLLA